MKPVPSFAVLLLFLFGSALSAVADQTTAAPPPELPVVMAVRSAPASSVFYDTEPARFELREPTGCRYRVSGWNGAAVAEGEWPGGGKSALELPELSRGYYTLALESDTREFGEPMSFAVVADAARRKPDPDAFFAVDTAQSWLSKAKKWNVRYPDEQFEAVSELCRRAGYGIVRDRFGWKHVEPQRGAFEPGLYGRNADLLAERGIAVCTLLDMTPEWAKSRSKNFPDDLVGLYESSKRFAERFRGKITAWEFFNEADSGGKGPAWTLAAGAKAFALGLKAGNPQITILNSSFHVSPLQHFAHTALKNGMGSYFDAFNYHVYVSPGEYPWLISRLRAEMAKYGLENMPLWLTENGTNLEGAAALKSYRPGTQIHSPGQEMLVAEFAPKSQILMQSLGVDRDFFFVMTPYWEQEGKKDWGLLRMDLTVKPAYVALATLNAELGHARLLGELEPAENIRGFLYRQPDGSRTLVYWSRSSVDGKGFDGRERGFRLKLPNGSYLIRNQFGTPSEARVENGSLALTATRFPSYLSGLPGLKMTKPFQKRPAMQGASTEEELSIVLNPVLSNDFRVADSDAFAIPVKAACRMKLEIFNLSSEEKSGTVMLHGGNATGIPAQITVKPFGKELLSLEVMPAPPGDGCRSDLLFSGEFAGRRITPAVIPLVRTEAMLKEGAGRELGWRNPARWRANSSGRMEITYDEQEKALKLRSVFKPGTDRWSYPEYLLELPAESPDGAIGVTFEIKAGPEISRGVSYTALMAVLDTVQEQGKAFWIKYPKVSGRWEKRVVVFGGFDPAEVRMLRIGMNPKCDDFTYYIRNIRVIHGK
ncbi:MAG: hypothetical protein HPZ91_02870 [Lentisphaeria bacterium]|nr:hypothetical protein [Lentisphaeria bacterium]